MTQSLAHITLIVRAYDEAIAWFTGVLGFTLVADQYQPEQDKRWILVAPPGAGENAATLLLARAATPEQEAVIGNQAGASFCFTSDPIDGSRPQGRTDDFARDYEAMRARGVRFVREPATHAYATVDVFEDLYGNLWDLIGPLAAWPRAVGGSMTCTTTGHARTAPSHRLSTTAASC